MNCPVDRNDLVVEAAAATAAAAAAAATAEAAAAAVSSVREKRANVENELINCNVCVYAAEDEGCLSVRWTEKDNTHFQNRFQVPKPSITLRGNGKSG
jgi:hypothetical protein